MHRRSLLAAGIAALAFLVPAAAAPAAPQTTASRTIQDCDDDNLLDWAPGEEHLTLSSEGDGSASGSQEGEGRGCGSDPPNQRTRLSNPHSILNFLQLTDFQMVDEESPARVEWLDFSQRGFFRPFSAAYRPQESLTTQVTEAMVRNARDATSPVTGERLDFSILTGDNADSQQYNETRWSVDILDGTVGPRPEGLPDRIDPNSGVPGAGCPDSTPGTVYDGVRDGGETGAPDPGYYEPDGSGPEKDDGDGYNPSRVQNGAEVGADVTVRDFPRLFERANHPFEAVGLGMPWYSAFGNHDALVQGNSPRAYFGPGGTGVGGPGVEDEEAWNPMFQVVATGCVKVMQPTAGVADVREAQEAIESLKDDPTDPNDDPDEFDSFDELNEASERVGQVFGDAFDELEQACPPGADPCREEQPNVQIVPRDDRRCFVAKDEVPLLAPPPCGPGNSWIAQHFRTTGAPLGHGFAPNVAADCAQYPDPASCREQLSDDERAAGLGRPHQAVEDHDGYYSFSPRERLRFVVLDSVTDECGNDFCSEGSVDHPQFAWLEDQLQRATEAGEYVLVFSHHTLRTTRQPTTDQTEIAGVGPGGEPIGPIHYGQRVDRKDGQPQNPAGGKTLEDLYCEYPNLVGHVNGHEHENYVLRHDCSQMPEDEAPASRSRDFWEISTAAHIDWPQQSRMIELVDDGGRLALVLTIIDHDGAANPGAPHDCRQEEDPNRPQPPSQPCELGPTGQAPEEPVRLASIAREIAYNDYQSSRSANGERQDRNVIVETGRPWPAP
jgi:hypothetical protein